MSEQQAPKGMISVEEFAEKRNMDVERVIKMIKDGFYNGRVVGEQWYVMAEELPPVQEFGAGQQYKSQYETSRKVSMFISGFGWLVFAIGIIAALAGLVSGLQSRYGLGVMGVLPGIGLVVSGLMMVVAGQVTRATVDNADHTREILALLKKDN